MNKQKIVHVAIALVIMTGYTSGAQASHHEKHKEQPSLVKAAFNFALPIVKFVAFGAFSVALKYPEWAAGVSAAATGVAYAAYNAYQLKQLKKDTQELKKGQGRIEQQVHVVDGKVDSLTKQVGNIEKNTGVIHGTQEKQGKVLNRLGESLDVTNNKIDTVVGSIEDSRKQAFNDIKDLENRIENQGKSIEDTITKQVATLRDRLTKCVNSDEILVIELQIKLLISQVGLLDGKIDNAGEKVENSINNLARQVGDNTQSVKQLTMLAMQQGGGFGRGSSTLKLQNNSGSTRFGAPISYNAATAIKGTSVVINLQQNS